MRLFLLTGLTMVAFAANSILNRMALEDGGNGAASFAAIRLVAGALMLAVLVTRRDGSIRQMLRWPGVQGPSMLALYVLLVARQGKISP